MSEKPSTPAKYNSLGMMHSLIQQFQLVMRLLRDRRVPLWAKTLPIISVAYLIWPIDAISTIPIVSAMDDLAVLYAGFKIFIAVCPPEVIQEHLDALSGTLAVDSDVVEGEVRPVEDGDEPTAGPIIDVESET